MLSRTLLTLALINLAAKTYLLVSHFSNNYNVVYVDSSKVINSYEGMITARKEFQAKVATWKANIDTLTKEITNETARYARSRSKLSSREQELTQKLVESKRQQLAQYQQAISEKANQEDAAATRKIIDEINAYIKSYGEQNGYTIVLAATEYGNIAYAKEYLDITDKVIEGLNNKYSGNGAK
jgi:outer membrane protein